MRVLVLGGTGRQAESILLDLLEIDTDNISGITLASRRAEALKERAASTGDKRVNWETIDIDDHDSLVALMGKYDHVMNAANSPTVYPAVRAALEARVNITSLLGLEEQMGAPDAPDDGFGHTQESYLVQLDESFKEANITGVLGWGYVPGTSNILGKYLGDKFDTIDSINWYYAAARLGDKLFFSETPREMVWVHPQPGLIFHEGEYVRIQPHANREIVRFPDPVGEVQVQHMPHTGLFPVFAKRYAHKNIRNMDAKLGYWAGYLEKMDWLEDLGLLDLHPRDVNGVHVIPSEVFLSGPGVTEKRGLQLQDYGCVRVSVRGTITGRIVEYTGDALARPIRNLGAMQLLAGIPAAIGIQMMAKGYLPKKGFYTTMDDTVKPEIYFEEVAKRNYQISISTTELVAA